MATLFKHEDGQAIRFSMPPCEERRQLSSLIQEHGGIITNRGQVDIRLAVSGKKVHSKGMVRAQYIHDCIKDDLLLDCEKYKIDPEAMSEVSDIEDEYASNILKVGKDKAFSGRKAYILSEDNAIIKYLLDNNEVESYRGNTVWKDMAFRKVTPHSWQSMKCRFSKHILGSIKQYVVKKKELQRFLKLSVDNVESEEGVEEEDNEKEEREEKSIENDVVQCQSLSSSDYHSAASASDSPQKQRKSLSPQTQSKSPMPSTKQNLPSPAVPSSSGMSLRKELAAEEEVASPTRHSPRKKRGLDQSFCADTSVSSVLSQPTVIERSQCSTKSSPEKSSPKKKKNLIMDFLQTQNQTFNESEMNGNDPEEDMEIEESQNEEVTKLLNISKKICQWLNLTQDEFLHVLYACNGSVSDAVNWILGDDTDVWNTEDDMCLLEGQEDSHDKLRKNHGSKMVEDRLKFLTEYLSEYQN